MFRCPTQNCTIAQYFSHPFPKPDSYVFTQLCIIFYGENYFSKTIKLVYLSQPSTDLRPAGAAALATGECERARVHVLGSKRLALIAGGLRRDAGAGGNDTYWDLQRSVEIFLPGFGDGWLKYCAEVQF